MTVREFFQAYGADGRATLVADKRNCDQDWTSVLWIVQDPSDADWFTVMDANGAINVVMDANGGDTENNDGNYHVDDVASEWCGRTLGPRNKIDMACWPWLIIA